MISIMFAQVEGQPPAILNFLPLVIFFIIFYVLLIRPQQKKQKEHKLLLSLIKKNDNVVTTGGIHGTVVHVKDSTLVLRVSDNAKLEIDRNAISHKKGA